MTEPEQDWRDQLTYLDYEWRHKAQETLNLDLARDLLLLETDDARQRVNKIMSHRWPNRAKIGSYGKVIHAVDLRWIETHCDALWVYNRRDRSVIHPVHPDWDVTCKPCLERLAADICTMMQGRGIPLHPAMQEIMDSIRNRDAG